MMKNMVINTIPIAQPALVHSRWIPSFLLILSNQSVGGNTSGVNTVKIVKLIVGDDR